MLAIGRALVTNPKVMLLDEPSAGLAVGIVRAFVEAVKRIRDTGVAILLVEQNLEIAAALAESCIVLAAGRVVWRGLRPRRRQQRGNPGSLFRLISACPGKSLPRT